MTTMASSTAFLGAAALLLLAGCTAPRVHEAAVAPPAPAVPAPVEEEPLPPHWRGAFTMVQAGTATAGQRQFRLVLGQGGPNRFVASRGCYLREGRLLRRGDLWVVESEGGVHADQQCLSRPLGHSGSPNGLFEHRTVRLSPPGSERWIEEGGMRWLYLQNPASPPVPPKD